MSRPHLSFLKASLFLTREEVKTLVILINIDIWDLLYCLGSLLPRKHLADKAPQRAVKRHVSTIAAQLTSPSLLDHWVLVLHRLVILLEARHWEWEWRCDYFVYFIKMATKIIFNSMSKNLAITYAEISLALWTMVLSFPSQDPATTICCVPAKVAGQGRSLSCLRKKPGWGNIKSHHLGAMTELFHGRGRWGRCSRKVPWAHHRSSLSGNTTRYSHTLGIYLQRRLVPPRILIHWIASPMRWSLSGSTHSMVVAQDSQTWGAIWSRLHVLWLGRRTASIRSRHLLVFKGSLLMLQWGRHLVEDRFGSNSQTKLNPC